VLKVERCRGLKGYKLLVVGNSTFKPQTNNLTTIQNIKPLTDINNCPPVGRHVLFKG
jgi:hypothetical protein